MKSFFKKHIHFIIFFVLSSAPFFWLSSKYIIYGPDTMFSINGSDRVDNLLPTWKDAVSFGYGWSESGRSIHNLLITIMREIGIPYSYSQKIILGLLIFISAYFSYLLCLEILGNKSRNARILATLSSFIYTLNPFAITWIWWRFLGVIYAYPCWPVLFYVFTRIVKQNISYKQLFCFSLLLSLLAPGVSAPILLLTLFSSGYMYIFIQIYLNRQHVNLKTAVSKTIVFTIFYMAMNAYWLIPGIVLLNNSISSALTAYDPLQAFNFNSAYAGLLNTLTVWGATALHITFQGQSYFGIGVTKYLSSQIYQTILLLPVLALILGLSSKKKSRFIDTTFISFAVVAIVGLFFMKAGNAPFGAFNKALLDIPFGAAFRIPYDKFGYFVAVSFTFIIVLAIAKTRNKWIKIILCSLTIVYVLVPLFVFFKPYALLVNDKSSLKGNVTKLPSEYSMLASRPYSAKDRFLVLPTAYNGESSFNWEKGVQANSHDILSDILPSQIIFLPNGNNNSDKLKANITRDLFSGSYSNQSIIKSLQNYGITQVFIHKDWNTGFMLNKQPVPQTYIDKLNSLDNLTITEDNKYFRIYSLSNDNNSYAYYTNRIPYKKTTNALNETLSASKINGSVPTSIKGNGSKNSILSSPVINNNSINYNFKISDISNKILVGDSLQDKLEPQSEIMLDDKGISSVNAIGNYINVTNNATVGNHSLKITNLYRFDLTGDNFNQIDSELLLDWECGNRFKNSISKASLGSILLKSTDTSASCHMMTFPTITKSSNVLMSFEYKASTSNGARFVIYQDTNNTRSQKTATLQTNLELPETNEWKRIDVQFYAERGKRYRPIIYSGLTDGQPSATEYRNVKAIEAPQDLSFSFVVQNGPGSLNQDAQSIESIQPEFHNFGSVRSFNTLKDDSLLVSNTSYDPLWKASYVKKDWQPSIVTNILGSKGRALAADQHVTAKGYANAWEIHRPPANSKLILEYEPQKYFIRGAIISLIFVTIGSIAVVVASVKNRHVIKK